MNIFFVTLSRSLFVVALALSVNVSQATSLTSATHANPVAVVAACAFLVKGTGRIVCPLATELLVNIAINSSNMAPGSLGDDDYVALLNQSQTTFAGGLSKGLVGVTMNIILWTAAQKTMQDYFTIQKLGSGEKPLLSSGQYGLAFQSGLDTVHLSETFLDIKKALDKISQNPHEVQESADAVSENTALLTSLVAGLATSYISFWGAEKFAFAITKNPLLATILIFNVGIAASAITKHAVFTFGQKYDAVKNCNACQEVWSVGDDLAWTITGVLPGYWNLLKSFKHVKTA